jgi:hypothetical protein
LVKLKRVPVIESWLIPAVPPMTLALTTGALQLYIVKLGTMVTGGELVGTIEKF